MTDDMKLIQYNLNNLLTISKNNFQNNTQVNKPLKEDLFYFRKCVQQNFDKFIKNNDDLFVFLGEKGTGKTWYVLNLFNQMYKERPVFYISLDNDYKKKIFDLFELDNFDYSTKSFINFFMTIDDTYEFKTLPIYWIFDSFEQIDKSKIRTELLEVILEIIKNTEKHKFILTSHPNNWFDSKQTRKLNKIKFKLNKYIYTNATNELPIIENFPSKDLFEITKKYGIFYNTSNENIKLLTYPIIIHYLSKLNKEDHVMISLNKTKNKFNLHDYLVMTKFIHLIILKENIVNTDKLYLEYITFKDRLSLSYKATLYSLSK